MPTKTELRLKYFDLTYNFNIPEELDEKLEEDYANNPQRYNQKNLNQLRIILLISPDIEFVNLITILDNCNKD